MHTFKLKDKVDKPTKKSSGMNSAEPSYQEWLKDNTDFEVAYISPSGAVVGVEGLQSKSRWEHLASDLTPKAEVFKVRVVKCSRGIWYKDRIGDEFEVEQHPRYPDWYKLKGAKSTEPDKPYGMPKSDCEIVTDQPSDGVIPFTEELFNQGKYEVYYDGHRVLNAHLHDGLLWGSIRSNRFAWKFEDLTLREKEVVVYFNIDSTGASGAKFKSIQECKDNKDSIDLAVIAFNMKTRKSETVWDYLNDKK